MSDQAKVLTTQNVSINYQVANVGERLLARLLDLVFFAVYLLLSFWVMGMALTGMDLQNVEKYTMVISILIIMPVITYTLWSESLFNGRTLGKLIMGLKVVKTDGTPAGIGDFAYRWILRLFEGEAGAFTCLSLPVAIISGKGQRIGDMVAGTMVIKSKQKSSLRNTILQQINPQYRVVFPQVAHLNDRDMNIIRDIMQQSFDTGNYSLLEYLGNKVKAIMGVSPPPHQLPTMQFLNIVLADYAHYNFEGK
ncbi:MAG: RDD family protein [Bacteroidota bacterium]|nr:RDD family protein [Bacteroidota bacterium]